MAEQTTYEHAKTCPICGQYGVLEQTHAGPRPGSKVEIYLCDNEACRWYKTGWTVQINRDGSIPDRRKGMKEFPDLKVNDANVKDYLDRLKSADEGGH